MSKLYMSTDKILKRIKSKKRGWVFCAKDFHDLGSRNTIDKTLSRLADDQTIIRLVRGVYYFPIIQKDIGIIPPDMNAVAKAIADNAGIAIYPSGSTSANMLGLSNQVPAQNIYLTHGKSITKHIGKNSIQFKHTRINPIPNTPTVVVMVLNALNYIGKNKVDDSVIKKCSKFLNDNDKKYLQRMSSRVSGWVSNLIQQIVVA
jgi:hypothetical protein